MNSLLNWLNCLLNDLNGSDFFERPFKYLATISLVYSSFVYGTYWLLVHTEIQSDFANSLHCSVDYFLLIKKLGVSYIPENPNLPNFSFQQSVVFQYLW